MRGIVICTSYNRCVVDLFGYTLDSSRQVVAWQEEEVAWGAFVPYPIVQAAADRSIQRLVASGAWPGRRRRRQWEAEDDSTSTTSCSIADIVIEDETVREWRTWDFVPDGLLVWEAWLNALDDARLVDQR